MEVLQAISGPELARLLGSWQRSGPGYSALAGALRGLILDGRVPLRARLPSERELASAVAVSRTTTTAAYDLLRAEGFVESRRGSGSRVALPTGGAADRELETPARDAEGGIDLTVAAPSAPRSMLEAVGRAVRDLPAHLGSPGYDPSGLRSLRREIANQFEVRGVPTEEEQVIVTSGAQHALRLLLDVLTAPGDGGMVEVPSYPNAFEAFRRAGVRLVPAPMGRNGWDLDLLEAKFRSAAPRVAYLICDFQNPTGFLMTDPERDRVVVAAGRAGAYLLVDETFALLDLEPWRPRTQPMAARDDDGRVVSIGSMSKAYWGGLRVGWIRCSVSLARRLARGRAAIDLATPVLEQLVAQHLLQERESVLVERRELLTARRDALAAALRGALPHWRFRVPRGGLCLWAELERPVAEELAEAARAEGVRIVPGPIFSPDRTLERFVRLPFTQPPEILEDAVTRLAAAERRLELRTRRGPVSESFA